MEAVYMKLVEMSISASWLVLVVMILRLLLKKSPRWLYVSLWALVAVRLLCPVSLESNFSLNPVDLTDRIVEDIPNSYVGPSHTYWDFLPEYQEAVEAGAKPIYAGEGSYYVVTGETPQTPVLTMRYIGCWVWICGMMAMLVWACISYFRLKRKVSASIDVGNRIFLCDYIDSPFILGIFSPRIYLPSDMDPAAADHVLAHERAHIARKDHWWKPFGYLLLTVYWFNPVLWLAYILLCRDIELACDERVIRNMEVSQKKAYSTALLSCSVSRRQIAACPLAFGEVGVKARVKSVMNYRKPGFWVILGAVVALIVTSVCFLTDPEPHMTAATAQWFEEYAYEQVKDRMDREDVECLDGTEQYALVYCRGVGPTLTLYRYEKQGKSIKILDYSTGEYAISAGMSLNHLEYEGQHIYFGSTSQYHWNPEAEVNTWIGWNHLTFTDADGEATKRDMLIKEGFVFVLDAPMQDFSVVDCLDTECLNRKKYLEQGYYMVEALWGSRKVTPESVPYAWTSTVGAWDIRKCWAYQGTPHSLFNTIQGDELDKLMGLLNDVEQEEIISRGILGPDDPFWDYEASLVEILCNDGSNIKLRYVNDSVIITPDSEFTLWETEGYWTIENKALKQWLYSISLGGTQMLSEENRQEIRNLVLHENVYFFNPQKYEDLLFVGCWYDGGRGMAVACYESLPEGYVLRKLIRGEEIKTCTSGSELYYCDYEDLRIFLIMNQNVTALEFAGDYGTVKKIDSHPGLVVAYFPDSLNTMYRFHFSGGATMYMDWDNKNHGKPPAPKTGLFDDPGDAYRTLSNLLLSDVEFVWASDTQEVDVNFDRKIVMDLSGRQTGEMLNMLGEIPESAYQKAEYPEGIGQGLEIYLSDSGGEGENAPWITLGLWEHTLYYRFQTEQNQPFQTWKINDRDLAEYVETFFTGDNADWIPFAPYPKTDGVISFIWEDLQITVPRVLCFQYEQTDEGIRFKPEDESGWIQLYYREGADSSDEKRLEAYPSVFGPWEAVIGDYEQKDTLRYMDITVPKEEMGFHVVLIYGADNSWENEYAWGIFWMIEHMAVTPAG